MSSDAQEPGEEQLVTVKYQDRDVPGVVVKVVKQAAPYDFELEDGATIRFVHNLTEVVRLVNERAKDGKPIYVMRHIIAPTVIGPERLRRTEDADPQP